MAASSGEPICPLSFKSIEQAAEFSISTRRVPLRISFVLELEGMMQAGHSLLRVFLTLPRDIERAQMGCTQQSLRELL